MQVQKTMENLRHVEPDQILWKAAKILSDGVQGAIFTVSRTLAIELSVYSIHTKEVILENDIKRFSRLHESMVFDNVGMLQPNQPRFLGQKRYRVSHPSSSGDQFRAASHTISKLALDSQGQNEMTVP